MIWEKLALKASSCKTSSSSVAMKGYDFADVALADSFELIKVPLIISTPLAFAFKEEKMLGKLSKEMYCSLSLASWYGKLVLFNSFRAVSILLIIKSAKEVPSNQNEREVGSFLSQETLDVA